jgi:hypothetical protein
VVLPDFQPMRVSEEPVCINLFRQNPVFTSLHLRYPVLVVPSRPLFRDGVPYLAWILILSVYGADTIAIDLSLSALIS